MNYDLAVLQRRHLLKGLEWHDANGPIEMTRCDDQNSCMDGRCPTCGSRLVHALAEFIGSDDAGIDFCLGGFLLNSLFVPENCDDELDLSAVKSALDEISLRMKDWTSWFIGWFGIFVDSWGGNGRKVGALAFIHPRVIGSAPIIKSILSKRFGRGARRLPFWQDVPDTLHFEELLYGYAYASTSRPDAEPVLDRHRLAEIALNYGQHRITDRVVTNGLAIEQGKIVASPGASWPLYLNKFDTPPERGHLTRRTRHVR
ncbi:hypothetical protein EHI42_20710 [Rhizobium hidalgonense]|uniref:hypothetical protein n=1 Tax=Rhizobium hidalgonense TaxID=1538159 RepID=UPI000FEC41F3|nr:hypothetical protein [Rhizobium hidalgonense]RWX13458.1 hypothetical protein EHI42_20710 [Rhizobium hidalgonense]